MRNLVILRHGQSKFNKKNIYSGRLESPLTKKGISQSENAAYALSEQNIFFSKIFTSPLERARHSASIIWEYSGNGAELLIADALISRNYGILEGMRKDKAREKYGEKTVFEWKRGFSIAPPLGESLADACNRTWPFLDDVVFKELEKNNSVLLVSHGNTLRSVAMKVENISKIDIPNLEIGNCSPIIYTFDGQMNLSNKIIISKKQ